MVTKKPLLLLLFISFMHSNAQSFHSHFFNEEKQCTSFVLDNNGYAVFGSNFDYGRDISEGLVFVNKRNVKKSYWQTDSIHPHACWVSKFGSVSFNLCMQHFSWAGMNEAGLVISTMELYGSKSPEPDSRPWIYSNYWLQYILDNFSTIEEVIASDSSIRIFDYVDHYLVSDRYGNTATIEFIDGKRVVHYGIDLPVKALSNSSYSKSLDSWKVSSSEANFDTIISKKGSSIGRFIIAANYTKQFKSIDDTSVIRIAFKGLEKVSGQCTKGSPTRWSIVFDIKNLKVYFKTIKNSKICQINLKELDFSCRASVKMIDINEPVEGDITHSMKEYSTDLHYKHALKAFTKWGSNPVPDELLKQIQFVEQFPCSGFENK